MRFYTEVTTKDRDQPERLLLRALSHEHARNKAMRLYKGHNVQNVVSRLSLETAHPSSFRRVVVR